MGRDKAILQYLERYGEPLHPYAAALSQSISAAWQQALVIPAARENDAFVRRLQQAPQSHSCLFVLVLNGPAGMAQTDGELTLQPLTFLQSASTPHYRSDDGFITLFHHGQHDFLVINLLQPPTQDFHQHGVGYARKLGMDLCLHLYAAARLSSPWVRSSDADVIWPDDYFLPLAADDHCSAMLYPFRHEQVDARHETDAAAAALYDFWLRYYVEGLRQSGSPWAFHTIGSTLAIHLRHYAINRGFPKREAGEDFYLLNKLAKTGTVISLQAPTLLLSNRISDRTPFGTGHAIGKIASQPAHSRHWPFYHPEIFTQLKIWHTWLPRLYDQEPLPTTLTQQPIYPVLLELGLERTLQHCRRQCRKPEQFTRHLWQWFDAAMTRKCVHLLRDRRFGTVSFAELQVIQEQREDGPCLEMA